MMSIGISVCLFVLNSILSKMNRKCVILSHVIGIVAVKDRDDRNDRAATQGSHTILTSRLLSLSREWHINLPTKSR